jgi:hypothetical protein
MPSVSGFKYYLVIPDVYSHYIWTFPLRDKSDVYTVFHNFQTYVYTHFSLPIRFIQCDNGREFDKTKNRDFFFPTTFCFVSLVHTLLNKMVKLNDLFGLSMIKLSGLS